jgi:hypothetical protein
VSIPRADCRAFALGFSWRRCAELFFESLAPCTPAEALRAGLAPPLYAARSQSAR